MESMSHGQPPSSPMFNATDSTCNNSSFAGFSSLDFSYVPPHIWEVIPKQDSLTILVHDESAFRLLENKVCNDYGEPTNMMRNGNIYRGCVSNGASVTLTFYQTTNTVRVQGAGYAHWATKLLPKYAKDVMAQLRADNRSSDSTVIHNSAPCTPTHSFTMDQSAMPASIPNFSLHGQTLITSTPVNQNSSRKPHSPAASDHNLQALLINNLMSCAETKARYETENAMLRQQIRNLEERNNQLINKVTEKEVQVQFMMAKVNALSSLESQLKLVEADARTDAQHFIEERNSLLQQIQDLSNPTAPPMSSSGTQTASYSNIVSSPIKQQVHPSSVLKFFVDDTPPTKCDTAEPKNTPPITPTTSVTHVSSVPTSNQFEILTDEVTPSSTQTEKQESNTKDSKSRRRRKPTVMILGDSISNRIEGQKLSRGANVVNKSRGGRTIERVCDDIRATDFSGTDSAIFHVGTNNLQAESTKVTTEKLNNLGQQILATVPSSCKVAISSIIKRTDKPYLADKVTSANRTLANLCEQNNWTYINNDAISDLADGLHPNQRGMSFLARNFQGFLRNAHPFLFRQGRKQTYNRHS